MQIDVAVLIDGQAVELNSDLQTLLQNVVGSYIKQSFFGEKIKQKKVKDPNRVPRGTRPQVTPEEVETITMRGAMLQDRSMAKAAEIISKEINRAWSTVYHRLHKATKDGSLHFTPNTGHYFKKGETATNLE